MYNIVYIYMMFHKDCANNHEGVERSKLNKNVLHYFYNFRNKY